VVLCSLMLERIAEFGGSVKERRLEFEFWSGGCSHVIFTQILKATEES
jgi:hypothetical protein